MATVTSNLILSATRNVAALLSGYSQDVVGIFDPDSGEQLFTEATAMKANINRNSKIMDHPKEDGSPVSDYKIILPVEIDMGILIDSTDQEDTYDLIKTAFLSSQFLTVQTNADVYTNMVVSAMPHDETPDMWGMLVMGLRLREVQLVTVQFQQLAANDVANTTDQSTVNTGEQTPQPAPQSNSVAYDLLFAPSKAGQ